MEELRKREKELGFTLLTIDVSGSLGSVRKILKEKRIDLPVLLDSESYAREYLRVMGTPTTFVIDEKGGIRCRLVGYIPDLDTTIEGVLERL
ncbi:MAG TPA: TlpA family protein disulfide reductase [Candidatus Eisenbacteria bacterium]|uniref:TlpA family protein disulfide reductase n=1 Tax=Eiseniibacteriota bacterium TaxID=2212470 RepID=A0A7V2F3A7_UNCEI|nr:TlpA family protein disulfide reductase [Candidatus Eisenbacteria bacterium]